MAGDMTSDSIASGRALLADRGVVRVAGEEAGKFLQGLVTNDLAALDKQAAVHAGLLTPQGKILFDFFVVKSRYGLLLETAGDKAADLAKRLRFYRLRAKIEIEDVSGELAVAAAWGEAQKTEGGSQTVVFVDPRLAAMGTRELIPVRGGRMDGADLAQGAAPEAYHAHRIALGVPEGGKDYVFGDTFPHEADLDQLNGIAFDKGCFVGQEVVSRMQHRGSARKRVVPIEGEGALTPGAQITAGSAPIGSVGSVAGTRALALMRLDRAAEAQAKGVRLEAGGVAITLRKPDWARAGFETMPAAAAETP